MYKAWANVHIYLENSKASLRESVTIFNKIVRLFFKTTAYTSIYSMYVTK